MAGIEKIKEKILRDAEDKAAEILEKAKLQESEILEKAKLKAESRVQEIGKKALHDANEKKRIIHSIVELEMRKDILAAKQELIEKVFKIALERLQSLENGKYEEVVFNMLMEASENGDEEVLMSEKDKKRLSPDFIEKANSALAASGKQGKLVMSVETRDISGGFILNKQGVEINNSFDAILGTYRDEIEPKVAEILFQ